MVAAHQRAHTLVQRDSTIWACEAGVAQALATPTMPIIGATIGAFVLRAIMTSIAWEAVACTIVTKAMVTTVIGAVANRAINP
jgi:hypothetical protein